MAKRHIVLEEKLSVRLLLQFIVDSEAFKFLLDGKLSKLGVFSRAMLALCMHDHPSITDPIYRALGMSNEFNR